MTFHGFLWGHVITPTPPAELPLLCSVHPPASLSSTVSHSYGYGLLDAGAIVALALNWTTVAPQHQCIQPMLTEPRSVARAFVYLSTYPTGDIRIVAHSPTGDREAKWGHFLFSSSPLGDDFNHVNFILKSSCELFSNFCQLGTW